MSKSEAGDKTWDTTIDRKACGIGTFKEPDLRQMSFVLSSLSSSMALVRAVLGHVAQTGECPPDLKRACTAIRVIWLFQASVEEIWMLGISENLEQHARKKHSEMDNIFQVKSWMEAMTGFIAKGLDPKNWVDVIKLALTVQDPLKSQKC